MREPAAVSEFLHELDRPLSGRRRWREEVLTEIHAHLLDAVEAAGEDPQDVQRLVERFGNPQAIAERLNEVDAHARRLRLRRMALVTGSSVATAVAAVAALATRSSQQEGGVAGAPAPSRLIGKVVAATPVASEIHLRSPEGAGAYSLLATR